VTHITPLFTERCNVRLDQDREAKRLLHWQSVAISACEQSGRQRVPVIAAPQALSAWLPQVKADQAYVLSPHIQNEAVTPALPQSATILLLIGPEGGLSESEVGSAIAQGFLPLNLGPRILRTETAPLAAIAILQYAYGDMKMR
jgi:16S rRNA (uracil1498-N3)-methyltransferase